MGTSARQILTLSYVDVGVLALGEVLGADLAQDGLRRLNNMVAGWRAQYGTVTAIERMIFPVVANKQTYSIGPGGDFNVPRPESVDGAGLWLNGLSSPQSVSSITRTGNLATVTSVDHGFNVGDEAYLDGADQIAYNGLQTVESVPTSSTFTFTVEGTPVTPATGTLTVAAVSGQPVEIPRAVITDDAYQSIQIKNLSNSQFTDVYYNTTYPLGTIFLWPRPNTAQNQLVLYLKNVFSGFADLDTAYDFPDIPGYAEALQYNFDLRIEVPSGRDLPPRIEKLAMQTLGLIKRANNKLTDLRNDASLLLNDHRYGYNINTGTGG